jgi:hypothetical protein
MEGQPQITIGTITNDTAARLSQRDRAVGFAPSLPLGKLKKLNAVVRI